MGGSESVQNKGELGKVLIDPRKFRLIRSEVDARFGEIRIYEKIGGKEEFIFQTTQNINNQQQFETKMKECAMRTKLSHPNLMQVISFSPEKCEEFCSSFWKLTIVAEYLKKDLSLLIRERQSFSEGELWHLIRALSRVLLFLKQQGVNHGDVYPGAIFVTPDGEVKISMNQIHNQHLSGYHQVILGIRKDLYLAPELLSFLGAKNPYPNVDWSQSEVFGIGLCMLEAGLGVSVGDIYDLANFKINQRLLLDRIQTLRRKYSPEFGDVVGEMLNLKEEMRLPLDYLLDLIEKEFADRTDARLILSTSSQNGKRASAPELADSQLISLREVVNHNADNTQPSNRDCQSAAALATQKQKQSIALPEEQHEQAHPTSERPKIGYNQQPNNEQISQIGALITSPDHQATTGAPNRCHISPLHTNLMDENGLIEGKYKISHLISPDSTAGSSFGGSKAGRGSTSVQQKQQQQQQSNIRSMPNSLKKIDPTSRNKCNFQQSAKDIVANQTYGVRKDTGAQSVLPSNYILAGEKSKILDNLDERINAVLLASQETVNKYVSGQKEEKCQSKKQEAKDYSNKGGQLLNNQTRLNPTDLTKDNGNKGRELLKSNIADLILNPVPHGDHHEKPVEREVPVAYHRKSTYFEDGAVKRPYLKDEDESSIPLNPSRSSQTLWRDDALLGNNRHIGSLYSNMSTKAIGSTYSVVGGLLAGDWRSSETRNQRDDEKLLIFNREGKKTFAGDSYFPDSRLPTESQKEGKFQSESENKILFGGQKNEDTFQSSAKQPDNCQNTAPFKYFEVPGIPPKFDRDFVGEKKSISSKENQVSGQYNVVKNTERNVLGENTRINYSLSAVNQLPATYTHKYAAGENDGEFLKYTVSQMDYSEPAKDYNNYFKENFEFQNGQSYLQDTFNFTKKKENISKLDQKFNVSNAFSKEGYDNELCQFDYSQKEGGSQINKNYEFKIEPAKQDVYGQFNRKKDDQLEVKQCAAAADILRNPLLFDDPLSLGIKRCLGVDLLLTGNTTSKSISSKIPTNDSQSTRSFSKQYAGLSREDLDLLEKYSKQPIY